MQNYTKAIAAIMLTVVLLCTAGCKKDLKIYNVNVSANSVDSGVVTGNGSYEEGQFCTVTATANDGYLFVNWTENGSEVSTDANYTFNVTGNRNLMAIFTWRPYSISVSAEPVAGGIVTGGGDFHSGDECTVKASVNDGFVFYYWSEDNEWISSDATYSFTVDRDRNLIAHFAMDGGDGHAYIDLDLPSGLLWATCNLGAETPEEYGDYFAWGETQPKNRYDWSTYQHSNGGTSGENSNHTKYCNNASYGYNGFTDDLTTLLPEDDAATANWGSGWRMPTKEEWQELYNNTICTWTTQNGVNGRLFTAANGVSLFLPAAGSRKWSWLEQVGSMGDYWSSSLDTDSPSHAWIRTIYSNGSHIFFCNRIHGLSVRAVRSSAQN